MAVPALDLLEDIHPVTEFRAHASSLIRQTRETGRPIVLTQNGRGAAVLLDIAAYQHLVDENQRLCDVQAAREDAREGRTFSHEEAQQRLLARIRKHE